MTTLYYTLGLPASGKTTLARNYVKQNPKTIRVNRDDLRLSLHDGEFSNGNEKAVTMTQHAMIRAALESGRDVVCDDTNLNPQTRAKLDQIAVECGAGFSPWDLTDVPYWECIKRDLKRERSVGEDVIRGMWERYLKPKPYPTDPGLRDCIIVDIDGTLAHMNGRSPYDWHRVREDKPNYVLIDFLSGYADRYADVEIIFMSGRDGVCFEDTRIWLRDHLGAAMSQNLLMRTAGDSRRDSIVKGELFEQHIRGRYNPLLVIDDRAQVVDELWRGTLNIPCWQVAAGRF